MSDYEIALEHKIVRRDLIISRLKNEIDELKELLDFASNEREAAEKERDSWKTQWVECCENLDIVAKERDRYKLALEFYADEKNYLTIHAENPAPNVVMDDGHRAREAIKDLEE